MDAHEAVRSQALAAIKMFREAVLKCPSDVWRARRDDDPFWFKAQHVLYWAQRNFRDRFKGFDTWKGHRRVDPRAPMSKDEILDYIAFIESELLSARVSFHPDKLEQSIADIRHIQQHTGELFERLGSRKGTTLHWTEHVRRKPK